MEAEVVGLRGSRFIPRDGGRINRGAILLFPVKVNSRLFLPFLSLPLYGSFPGVASVRVVGSVLGAYCSTARGKCVRIRYQGIQSANVDGCRSPATVKCGYEPYSDGKRDDSVAESSDTTPGEIEALNECDGL